MVKTKCVFKNKLDKEGNVSLHKTRLVAQGFTQREGENFDDTFAAVVRIDTFRIFCATAAKYNHKLCGIDFEGAYLQSDIDAEIHIQLPNESFRKSASSWPIY